MLEIDSYIPRENWFIGLIFDEGYWVVRLVRKQQTTVYKYYAFNNGSEISAGSTSGWETPTDTEGRYYLEPQDEDIIYQVFLGISPSAAKIYLSYPRRVDRMNLITVRDIPGNIGYWDGETSPIEDPSPQTELWIVKDIVPYFNAENPGIAGKSQKVYASFFITPFSYKVVRDKERIKRFIDGKERCTFVTMGDPDRPISAPRWLLDGYQQYMLEVEED